jgi:hypothetical protein
MDGVPVPDAVVELHNPTGDVLTQVRVDDDGRFIFYLRPGTWSLKAWDSRGHNGAAEVTLTDEAGTSAQIDLR